MQASKQESGRALPAAVCCLRGVLHGFSYVFEVVCCWLFSQCASLIPICHVAVVLPVVGVFNQVLFALVACRFSIVMCGFCCHIKIPPRDSRRLPPTVGAMLLRSSAHSDCRRKSKTWKFRNKMKLSIKQNMLHRRTGNATLVAVLQRQVWLENLLN